jgi:hypothetical protein
MATLFTITITTGAGMGAARSSEREQIKYLLEKAIQAVGDGSSTSGSVIDRVGTGHSWTYSPVASS